MRKKKTPKTVTQLRKALPKWWIKYSTFCGVHQIRMSKAKPNALFRRFDFGESPKHAVVAAAYAAARAFEGK